MLRTIFDMMLRPMKALNATKEQIPWPMSLIVSGLAFGLFFLLTGLDLFKTGQKGFLFVVGSVASGLAYGLVVIPVLAVVMWLIMKLFKTEQNLKWAIRSLCMSYSGALVYGIVGLVCSLFLDWKVSIAFGLTGVLWAIGPMFFVFRKMSKDNIPISLLLSTVIGSAVLYSWSLFGSI